MSGSKLKADARQVMFENAPRLFFIVMIYLALVVCLSEFSFRLPGEINMQNMLDNLSAGELFTVTSIYRNFRPFGAFLAIIINILRPVLEMGFMSFCLKIKRKETTEIMDLFDGFRYFFKVITIFILTSVFIILWGLLLVIPGIVAYYRYRLVYYILLDDPEKSAIRCIRESTTMMHGSKVDLFIIDLSFLGWHMLDITVVLLLPLPIALPLVSIWIVPYERLTHVLFYEQRKSILTV